MDLLRELFAPYLVEWLLGIIVVQLVIFTLVVVNWVKFRQIRRQQKRLLRGMTRDSLEQLIDKYMANLQTTERHLDEAAVQLDELKRKLAAMKGYVGMVRYNALAEQGSDLSYSLAILDEEQNGVVISSLYGRHQSYSYAKPLSKGTSEYSLSNEEKEAIALAVGKREKEYA